MLTGLHTLFLFSYTNLTQLTMGGTAQSGLDLPTLIINLKKYASIDSLTGPSEVGSYSVDLTTIQMTLIFVRLTETK